MRGGGALAHSKAARRQVKTNRRDALSLQSCCVPTNSPRSGAGRTSRGDARSDAGARDGDAGFAHEAPACLGLSAAAGRPYPESKNTWTKAHVSWIASQKLEHPQQRLVLEEMMLAIRQAQERLARLEQAIAAAVPEWSLAPVVTALMAMRGMDLVSATTLLARSATSRGSKRRPS